MLKFGQFVCKHKKTILIIALILLIPSILGMKATRTNYDILAYLPDNIETIQGQNILKDDFNMGAFSVIILENMDSKDIIKLEDNIKKLDNVQKVVGAVDVLGTSITEEGYSGSKSFGENFSIFSRVLLKELFNSSHSSGVNNLLFLFIPLYMELSNPRLFLIYNLYKSIRR